MKFNIIVKSFMNGDITHDSSIAIERDDFEMYLSALTQDIETLDGVLGVIQNESDIEITTQKLITENQLKKLISPFLEQLKCNIIFSCSSTA